MTTIFSAPNYCGKGNKGAYIGTGEDGKLEITQFGEATNKPCVLRNNDNVFSYYMVDLSVWVDEFLYVLFSHLDKVETDDSKKKILTRSLSKVSDNEEEKQYYDRVVSNASLGIVDEIKFNSGKSVLKDAMNVLADLKIEPTLQFKKQSGQENADDPAMLEEKKMTPIEKLLYQSPQLNSKTQ